MLRPFGEQGQGNCDRPTGFSGSCSYHPKITRDHPNRLIYLSGRLKNRSAALQNDFTTHIGAIAVGRLFAEVRGKFHSLWVKICWSWNSNNRNIVTGQAEFIAGDWITWWRFKFRLYAKKILSNFIFKRFEKNQKIFSFSKIEKSEIFWFWLLEYFPFSENISQISIFQISISQISKRQNRKISDFFDFGKWKYFLKIFKTFKNKIW